MAVTFEHIRSFTYSATGNKKKVVLMTHGFNSSKEEVNGYFISLKAKLETIGVSSFAPDLFYEAGVLLPLKKQYEIVCEAVRFLMTQDYEQIYACGFSLGSFLAMRAAKEFEFKKIFLLSPVYSLKDDFSTFLGFKIPEMLSDPGDYIVFHQEGIGDIRIPKDFLVEISDAENSFDVAGAELVVISGGDDFSAANHDKIRLHQSATGVFHSHIFPKTDHIFNAFDPEKQKLDEVSNLIIERV